MDETGTGRSDRLESWKEIAAYLGRGVTTVQRWEQQEGLPVHRLPHAKKGSVFAIKAELDAWRQSRAQLALARSNDRSDRGFWQAIGSPARIALGIVGVVAVAAIAVALTRDARQTQTSVAVGESPEPLVPKPLSNDAADEACPSLSPDGSEVVYHWNRASEPGLYIKTLANGQTRRLATERAGPLEECAYAKWSPQGDLIAFLTQGEAGAKHIWVIAPTDGGLRRLTSITGIGLTWAPDGSTLAFVDRNSPGEPFSFFAVTIADGRRRRLTNPPLDAFGDTFGSYSPDGRRLAIVRYPSRVQSDLFVVTLNDSERETVDRLTTDFMGIEGVEWSPDGSQIVLGSHMGLWKISATAAGKPTRVAAFDGGAKYPTFSRPARGAARVAYESNIRDVNVWHWDLSNGKAMKVAGSTWWDDAPSLEPNGNRVAFVSNRTGANEIWTSNLDGSGVRQITFHRGPVVTFPQWSRDGKHLAFSSYVAGNRDIYVSLADGAESTRLTTAPSEESNPTWSRDGRTVYFRSNQGGIGQLWKVPATGGSPVRVTIGEGSEGFESPDGTTLYFVRSSNTPGLWQVPVAGGREVEVIAEVREGLWGVADRGIYYMVPSTGGTPKATLKFFDFATKSVSTLPSPPAVWERVQTGFSVSRDGNSVLWTQLDREIRDLMLIDQWRP